MTFGIPLPDPVESRASDWAHVADSDDSPPPEPARVFAPITAASLIREYPELRPIVVADLLREGETMNVVAAPKFGKSWLVHALALSVASGRPWLGKRTVPGRVLLIDAELHRETLAKRLRTTQSVLGVPDAALEALEVWPVRGQRLTIDAIAESLAEREPGEFRLIVLDALYRFLPLDGEENANETMTRVYNTLDAIAKHSRAAVVVVHHASKGNQSEKAVTDVGAGAGSQSRAADTHLILRPHETEGAVVVDAAVRSFPPLDPFVIRSTNPGWVVDYDLDPALLRQTSRRRKTPTEGEPPREARREWTPGDFALEVVGSDRSIRDDVIARALALGIRKTEAESLLRRAMDAGHVHRHHDGPSAPHRFSIDPPAASQQPDDGAGGTGGTGRESPAPRALGTGGVGGTE